MFGAAWVTMAFLLSLRLGAMLLVAPIISAAFVPTTIRIMLTVALCAALAMGLEPDGVVDSIAAGPTSHWGLLIESATAEIGLGITLGLGIALAFAAFSVAGHLLDVQIGFGIGQVFDPVSNTQSPLLTSAFNQLALIGFFLVDGHHALMRGLVYSLNRFPLGHPWALEDAWLPFVKQVAGLFSLGFALAAPVAFCLLLVDLALGVVARNLPQMNMIALGIPVKIVVGMVALSLWYSGMSDVMGRTYATIFRTWDEMFELSSAHAPAVVRFAASSAGASLRGA